MGHPLIANEITLPTVAQQTVMVNENYKVDVNRGCHIRIMPAGREYPEGMAIYMYVDKPGYFMNDHARPVPPEMAAVAGFEVETLLKARRKQEAFARARQEIEAQYQQGLGTHEVVEESDEYRLVHIGHEQYIVEFDDGSSLTPTPVSREMATKAFRSMAGLPDQVETKPTKK